VPGDPGDRGTLVLAAGLALLGVAIVARTIDAGDGPFSPGVLMGAGFVLAGAVRGWTARSRG
jgi:multisubunit Na+/H+ antiporter MnhB subunit